MYTKNPDTDAIEKWKWVLYGKGADIVHSYIQSLMPFQRLLLCCNDEDKICQGYATSPPTEWQKLEQGYNKKMVLSPAFSDTKVIITFSFHNLTHRSAYLTFLLSPLPLDCYNPKQQPKTAYPTNACF